MPYTIIKQGIWNHHIGNSSSPYITFVGVSKNQEPLFWSPENEFNRVQGLGL